MKIKDVSYIPCSKFLLTEKVDDITRYLQLSAEYGCNQEGKKFLISLAKRWKKVLESFRHWF